MKAASASGSRDANPLVGGILAAAFGSALPLTRQEQERLGSLGDKAREMIDENKEQVTTRLREKTDQLLEKTDQALQPEAGGDSDAPFIAAS